MFRDDDAGEGAPDVQRLLRLSSFAQRVDLFRGDIEVIETRAGGFPEIRARTGAAALRGDEIILLRRKELGRVEGEKRLVFLDRRAQGIDIEFLDPTGDLGVYVTNGLFVVVHDADRADRFYQRACRDLLDADAHVLHDDGADRDLTFEFVRIERDEIHRADRAGAGFGQDHPRMHAAGPVLV